MLVGLNKETNKKVYAYNCNIENIKKLTKENIIVCQDCNTPLTLKAGKIKTTHFAHKDCNCSNIYSEPESEEHMKGKIALKERLSTLYPNSFVEMEYRIEETNQISDVIVIHPNGDRWAFEVQCTQIPVGTLVERSILYRKAGVMDFWFLNHDIQRYNRDKLTEVYGTEVAATEKRLFRIHLHDDSKDVNVSDTLNVLFNIRNLIIKRDKNKDYIIEDIDKYKIAAIYHKAFKDYFKAHLENLYPNSVVVEDYKLEGFKEVVDLMLISKKDNSKCAFNIIYGNTFNHNIDERMKAYKALKIPVFWFFGTYSYNNKHHHVDIDYNENINVYYPHVPTDKWFITIHNYGNESLTVPVKNLVLTKQKYTREFILDDEVTLSYEKEKKYNIIKKKIEWFKDRESHKWHGMIYNCYQQLLKDRGMSVASTDDCEKCRRFDGYIYDEYKPKKKICVKCKQYHHNIRYLG